MRSFSFIYLRDPDVIQGEYQVELRDDAQLFPSNIPRKVSLPLLGKLEAEIDRMLTMMNPLTGEHQQC